MDSIETLFTIKPDAPDAPVDALLRTLDRAYAITHLLIGDCARASDPVIVDALDALGGHLIASRAMVEHWAKVDQGGRE